MTLPFTVPPHDDGAHHAEAADGNAVVAEEAVAELRRLLNGPDRRDEAPDRRARRDEDPDRRARRDEEEGLDKLDQRDDGLDELDKLDHRILLKAAAGAGKSFVLKRLVAEAVAHERCTRVAIVAFTNKQTWPLALSLTNTLGREAVCLFAAAGALAKLPDEVADRVTVATSAKEIPPECQVIISTVHKLGVFHELTRHLDLLGPAANGETPYDVLFVDEAWQIPHHLFTKVSKAAHLWVGVGDVGQLSPLEIGDNPWRGDSGYNPYRAWPTAYDDDENTWARELPTVWRPAVGHLGLWRRFYPEWSTLNCVAGPGDRGLEVGDLPPAVAAIWEHVGTGVPTLVEIDGLEAPDAPDIDLPLMLAAESLIDQLFAAGFALTTAAYDARANPTGKIMRRGPGDPSDDALIAVLATRGLAVEDATDAVERLREHHGLLESDILASTVDSYQGQTNGITVAIHPLNGATGLDAFNSEFGRLAVTCTRATHGLLMLARPGLDTLLDEAPARPGTPFGEPGNRSLPRQTHRSILEAFGRVRVDSRDVLSFE
ncbi:AAA domain-containing protein [Paraoerskovia marina]|uniref:AAA domain-containing protein n=1 Tax=Paraoerskovia marina TaxID=545619 RepID=A0A1H1NUV5_9CELL|nr:AAA family ATPase [Paraoerskovia marina]SDS02149.1 AAA domain-containing protein [Paraoerskovia marina]